MKSEERRVVERFYKVKTIRQGSNLTKVEKV